MRTVMKVESAHRTLEIQASTQPTDTLRARKLGGWAEETIDTALHEAERADDRGGSIQRGRCNHR
jgi:hypothetical protein